MLVNRLNQIYSEISTQHGQVHRHHKKGKTDLKDKLKIDL